MKANGGEFDEEDLEDEDMAIPAMYVEEEKIILITKARLTVLEACTVQQMFRVGSLGGNFKLVSFNTQCLEITEENLLPLL